MIDYSDDYDADMPLFSHAGRSVSEDLRIRAGSQRWELLKKYVEHGPLTNEQAGDLSGLSGKKSCCYWKRCSELLKHGYLEDTGTEIVSQVGEMQRVCRVTSKGITAIKGGA